MSADNETSVVRWQEGYIVLPNQSSSDMMLLDDFYRRFSEVKTVYPTLDEALAAAFELNESTEYGVCVYDKVRD